jgi:hypothetical protein
MVRHFTQTAQLVERKLALVNIRRVPRVHAASVLLVLLELAFVQRAVREAEDTLALNVVLDREAAV